MVVYWTYVGKVRFPGNNNIENDGIWILATQTEIEIVYKGESKERMNASGRGDKEQCPKWRLIITARMSSSRRLRIRLPSKVQDPILCRCRTSTSVPYLD